MKRLLLILLVTICVQPLFSQTLAPVLFYSDLDSGPATGGQGGNGVSHVFSPEIPNSPECLVEQTSCQLPMLCLFPEQR